MELYLIPVDSMESSESGKVILYRPLAGLAFVGNGAMADLASRLAVDGRPPLAEQAGPAVEFLEQIGFFEPDPPAPAPRLPDPGLEAFQPTRAVLLLTNRCQLRCTYCYAAAGEHPRQDLSFELGKVVIDAVADTALQRGLDKFTLAFHGGGEPTTAWSVMQACVDYARKKPILARISLTSNAIWSRSQMDWVLAQVNELGVSLDGSPQTQNRQRPFASGRGSSGWVMRSLAELDRHSFYYGLRMTATAPWESLAQDVQFLCQETGCRSIQVEPAFNSARGAHSPGAREAAQQFVAAFLQAHEIAAHAGRRLFCSAARLGMVASMFCTAPYEALIVNGEGNLVTCYEISGESHPLNDLSTIGKVENGQVRLDGARRAQLHAALAERRAQCRACFCNWSCAGDCYPRVFDSGPDGHLTFGARCEMNRTLTKELLLRAIAEQAGVWRSAWRAAPVSAYYSDQDGLG